LVVVVVLVPESVVVLALVDMFPILRLSYQAGL
jgi:hypothetical protein